MISYWTIVWILFAHWFADFVCQSNWQAKNKSSNWYALTDHVLVYTVVLAAFMFVCFDSILVWLTWSIINFAAHFWIDAVTSRISKRLWLRNEVHWFFVVIGFDQLLHYVVLFKTFEVLHG